MIRDRKKHLLGFKVSAQDFDFLFPVDWRRGNIGLVNVKTIS